MMRSADIDEDGEISFTEFRDAIIKGLRALPKSLGAKAAEDNPIISSKRQTIVNPFGVKNKSEVGWKRLAIALSQDGMLQDGWWAFSKASLYVKRRRCCCCCCCCGS